MLLVKTAKRKLFLPLIVDRMKEQRFCQDRIPRIVAAEKYFFESGNDSDEELVKAVHSTSEEMIDFGIFHLPYPSIWVEDPIDPNLYVDTTPDIIQGLLQANADCRMCYLAEEKGNQITIQGYKVMPLSVTRLDFPLIEYYDNVDVIDLSKDRAPVPWTESHGKMGFALRQLLVTLATPQASKEVITVSRHNETKPITERHYSHTVVRVKFDKQLASHGHAEGTGEGSGGKRKLHLVAGYIYGKHTRPREEQRFVQPFWRGDIRLGIVDHERYEV